MSITVTTDLFCDKCCCWDEDVGVSGVTVIKARLARAKAKDRGWIRRNNGGRMEDICPNCHKVKEV